MTLFAVHISDGVLTAPFWAGGFVLAALLLLLASWRIRDEEIPRIAVLGAAFFVSSQIRIPVGPTVSIHLLLTGLVGVVLGLRAALAIFVGLVLQAFLMEHGGRTTVGVNTCVMTLPALLCWGLFQGLHRIAWIKTPIARGVLVAVGAIVWFMSGVYSLTLITTTSLTSLDTAALDLANARLVDPWFVAAALLFAVGAIYVERCLEHTPEFPLGFLIGELAVLMTAGLNCVVLLMGGETNWPMPPLVLVIAHLPFAVIEGVILGFVVGFLAKVKPEMLGQKMDTGGREHHGGKPESKPEPVIHSSV